MAASIASLLQVFLVSTLVLTAVRSQEKKNPFLVQQKAHQQHFQQQKQLQQLQQAHQLLDNSQQMPPAQKQQPQPQPQPEAQAPVSPDVKPSPDRAPPKAKPSQERSAPKTKDESPFTRHPDSTHRHRSTRRPRRNNDDHGHSQHNRNEMHKSTWTRWTEKPPARDPWGKQTSKVEMAECSGKQYNARESICCHGEIRKRQGLRPACCGSVAFDFVFNLCCEGKVTPRTAGRPFC